ncbi:MAG: hypothetical protein JWN01_883 [Patescibacteria group bacterium]|nr:hypothetical protein [Patescibacteria group bacterium]
MNISTLNQTLTPQAFYVLKRLTRQGLIERLDAHSTTNPKITHLERVIAHTHYKLGHKLW